MALMPNKMASFANEGT